MGSDKLTNTAVILLVLAAGVLWLAKRGGEAIEPFNFIALGVLAFLAFLLPLAGFVLSVPVLLLVYMRYNGYVLKLIENRGGM